MKDRIAEYVDSPCLRQRLKVGKEISCLVDGTYGIYRTRIVMNRTKIQTAYCSCPSDYRPCKHAQALAITYRRVALSFEDIDELIAKLNSKSHKELVSLIQEMVRVAPASLHALGVKGFEDEREEEFEE